MKRDEVIGCKLNYGIIFRASFDRLQKLQKLLAKQVDLGEIVYQDISADRMWIKKTSNEMNEGEGNDRRKQ